MTPARAAGADAAARLGTVASRLSSDAGSALLLVGATLLALVWANSPWADGYDRFWHTPLAVSLGSSTLSLDLQHWVNDGLMTFFFFLVGLEVKRELTLGDLTDRRRATVPLVAAATGLVVPAVVFYLLAPDAAKGAWGVVISTDTAFLLGVLAVAGPARAMGLRLFLLALAVADDVAALAVIAVVYVEDLDVMSLVAAAVGVLVMVVLERAGVWRGPPYLLLAVVVWLFTYRSGVHPTVTGVVIALFTRARLPERAEVEQADRHATAYRQSPSPESAVRARASITRSMSANERMQLLYRPWVVTVVVPLFALSNAGVRIDVDRLADTLTSTMVVAVVVGLVGGKLLGVWSGAVLASRLGWGQLLPGVDQPRLLGGAALCGMGFTISLFIVDLALDDPDLADQARLGVLVASVLALALGLTIFRTAERRRPLEVVGRPTRLDREVSVDADHVEGPVDAPLTLVEYGDFECPFCGRATGAVDQVRAHFGDQLRYVFRHLPLPEVHPRAEDAAAAAEAAARQGSFWRMHDELFKIAPRLEDADLTAAAQRLGLDLDRFHADRASSLVRQRVRADAASADLSGAAGTPTFFINGVRHEGPWDARTLIRHLRAVAEDRVGSTELPTT